MPPPAPAESPKRQTPAWLLPALMLAGAVLGMIIGGIAGPRWRDPDFELVATLVRTPGTIFLSILQALVVPLVVTSIVVGVTKMGDLRKVGRIAGLTAFYFLSTTFLAVGTGLLLVGWIQPGKRGVDRLGDALPELARETPSTIQAISEVITGMFPPNLFAAASEGNMLGLIIFSLLFGGMLTLESGRSAKLVELFDIVNEALLRLVRIVLWLAPLGVMGLVADRIGSAGGGAALWGDLERLAWYGGTVMLGLAVHSLVTLPILLRFFTRRSPARYAGGMADALVTAVGTGSSAATMSVTLRCLIEKNGVSRRAADFVIPLGTTVNMDGTALYEAVAVLFIAQTLGVELSLVQQIVVLFTATLAAIGAAAIPEAGLVTMVIVLGAVGLPAEGIGIILAIDWMLDRFRTGVNVWGDSVGAGIIDRVLGENGEGSVPLPSVGDVAVGPR